MAKVILQPYGDQAARKHYIDTIENPVGLGIISQYLPADFLSTLRNDVYPAASIPVWGVTPGQNNVKVPKWNRVERGDVVLFARNKAILASASVIAKIHNQALPLELWGVDDKGQTWEYLYFLGEIKKHHIPLEEFNLVAGYEPNNLIRGFEVLNEEKSAKILDYFNLFPEVYIESISAQQFSESLAEYMPEQLDAKASINVRREQGFLRQHLFRNHAYKECAICGKAYPVEFLVAAHIKKRSECSPEEKRDHLNVVVPMCKFGCDELYEKRYIGVSETGKIIKLRGSDSKVIENYISTLIDGQALYWNESREKYFSWHRKTS